MECTHTGIAQLSPWFNFLMMNKISNICNDNLWTHLIKSRSTEAGIWNLDMYKSHPGVRLIIWELSGMAGHYSLFIWIYLPAVIVISKSGIIRICRIFTSDNPSFKRKSLLEYLFFKSRIWPWCISLLFSEHLCVTSFLTRFPFIYIFNGFNGSEWFPLVTRPTQMQ